MASVHPSRLGLVPGASSSNAPRSQPPPRDERQGHSRSNDYDPARREDELRRKLREGRGGEDDTRRSDYRDSRHDDRRRERSRDRGRRASPSYDSYRRPPSPRRGDNLPPAEEYMSLDVGGGPGPGEASRSVPWRGGNEHGRFERQPPPHHDRGDGGPMYPGGGGNNFRAFQRQVQGSDLEMRRRQRDTATIDIWPASPKRETLTDDEDDRKKKSSSSRHHRSSRKHKRSSHRHRRKRSYDSDDSLTPSEDSDSEDDRRRKHRREKQRSRSRSERADSRPAAGRVEDDDDEDEWVAKDEVPSATAKIVVPGGYSGAAAAAAMDEDDDDAEVGPQLPADVRAAIKHDPKAYANMLRGEGAAMAAFAEAGQRIPRRGEIGLEADEIEKFEAAGYVMSGSRHRRMNAVRMRKENQVISAEEKRGILKLQKEEKDKREAMIREQFKSLIDDKLASSKFAQ